MAWVLERSDVYNLCVSQIGGDSFVERALAGVLNALSLNPFAFYKWGVANIWIAQTCLLVISGEIIPALTLRYKIEPPTKVELLHLEISPPDEMELSDRLPWA